MIIPSVVDKMREEARILDEIGVLIEPNLSLSLPVPFLSYVLSYIGNCYDAEDD
jgi:hypothetical protein